MVLYMIRLLQVDDDLDVLQITMMALSISGLFEVKQCSDPESALREAQDFAPDVLLLDFMMPHMSGDVLLSRLREIPGIEATAAIFMTARVQPDKIQKLLEIGAADVILKPFDPLTLATEYGQFSTALST